METNKILLIGTGPMAQEYAKVLKGQSKDFEVIGRGKKSAKEFESKTKVKVNFNDLDKYLKKNIEIEFAIVAVNTVNLTKVSLSLIRSGVKNILIEKPGALSLLDINHLKNAAEKAKSKAWIAYNRRHYTSVIKLKKLAKEEGGIKSLFFEFTELTETIDLIQKSNQELSKWFLANSTHVIDLAFHLIGFPKEKEWNYFHQGKLKWHNSSSRFAGAGISHKNIPFSYHADWESPGRWCIEAMTLKNRYILKPMEMLQVIRHGSFKVNSIDLDNSKDIDYKAGLFKQCQAFLEGNTKDLCSINSQAKAFNYYYSIAGYKK